MALAGWTLDNEVLKGAGGAITMKANAAVGLFASGLSLRLIVGRGRVRLWLALACAVVAGAIGMLTLSEHLVGWNLGIDELLFIEAPGALATASPGRMGLNGSVSLSLASLALLLLRWRPAASQQLAFAMTIIATVAIVGYWYGAQELYGIARFTGIAWPTAFALLVLSFGILMARPDARPIAAILGDGPGGVMARRLLIPAVVVSLALGYARVQGQQLGLFDTGLGTALFVVSVLVLLTTLIWRTALTLDDIHLAREAARHERDELLVRESNARETAERANQLKDEFLAALSHELRTPLNAVLGWIDMLRSDVVAPERRTHAAEVVARNGKLLARLIEDLLDISRMATGQLILNLHAVDMNAVTARAIESIEASAKAKGVRLSAHFHEAGLMVSGDPERLQQVLGNLLANAVKFTSPGGSIDVTARPVESGVEVVVRDSGQGIRPEFLPHVFERFRKGDTTTTAEHGGLGLGLSIVRELTELHGGSVKASSDGDGRGATFSVFLPSLDERSREFYAPAFSASEETAGHVPSHMR
jgi:signal transduction histidine kinase